MTDPLYDVALVGAGMAGAVMAHALSGQGLRVILLEAGSPYGNRSNHLDRFFAAAAKTPDSPWPPSIAGRPTLLEAQSPAWRSAGNSYMEQLGPSPFHSTYERIGGGTSAHWLGAAPRLVPADFEMRSRFGTSETPDWPLDYAALEPWYCEAESLIGVAGDHDALNGRHAATRSKPFPMPPIAMSYLDRRVAAQVNGHQISGCRIDVRSTPQARNSIAYDGRPACCGNSSCIPICPIQARYDATVHLDRAVARRDFPAEIRYRSIVHRLSVDPVTNRIDRLHVRSYDVLGGGISEHEVRARIVVVCAHGIETPRLLLNSPWRTRPDGSALTVANSSDQVGRNLMDHVVIVRHGLASEPLHPFRGPQMTASIDAFRDGPRRRERAAYRIDLSNLGAELGDGAPLSTVWDLVAVQGLRGRALQAALRDRVSRQICLHGEAEMLPSPDNRVTLSSTVDRFGMALPAVRFAIDDYTKSGLAEAADSMEEILRRMGVADIEGDVGAALPEAPGQFVYDFGGRQFRYRGSGHILGTCRMGHDAAASVTDADGRTHDHANLFIAGSALFPSGGTANPTLTLLALALKTTDAIVRDIGSIGERSG